MPWESAAYFDIAESEKRLLDAMSAIVQHLLCSADLEGVPEKKLAQKILVQLAERLLVEVQYHEFVLEASEVFPPHVRSVPLH